MHVGIVGFPGSGKTTLFQALSDGSGGRRNGVSYGTTKVPDPRVDRLAEFFSPRRTTYAEITFVDIPGRAGRRGAAFHSAVLQQMRNAVVLVHVVRAFQSPFHSDPADPARDVSALHDEIVLLDAAILEKRQVRFQKEHRTGPEVEVNRRALGHLEEGHALRTLDLSPAERATLHGIQLLSLRPLVTVYNIAESAIGTFDDHRPSTEEEGGGHLAICGPLECEIAALSPAEQPEFLEALGLERPARHTFVQTVYEMLDLISFLTCGQDECRAWPIRRGVDARRAAGTIHSDLERGFIRAEVFQLDDLERYGTEAAIKAAGRMRVEGRGYHPRDGDVMHFLFNV